MCSGTLYTYVILYYIIFIKFIIFFFFWFFLKGNLNGLSALDQCGIPIYWKKEEVETYRGDEPDNDFKWSALPALGIWLAESDPTYIKYMVNAVDDEMIRNNDDGWWYDAGEFEDFDMEEAAERYLL